MASLNKVQLIGYLGGKPELRMLNDGVAVATFSVATNARWKNKAGEPQERTDWHRVVFYRGAAEVAAKHLDKGSHIFLQGELRNRSYEKDDETHYITEIVGSEFQFLDKKDATDEKLTKTPAPKNTGHPADWEDDVPF